MSYSPLRTSYRRRSTTAVQPDRQRQAEGLRPLQPTATQVPNQEPQEPPAAGDRTRCSAYIKRWMLYRRRLDSTASRAATAAIKCPSVGRFFCRPTHSTASRTSSRCSAADATPATPTASSPVCERWPAAALRVTYRVTGNRRSLTGTISTPRARDSGRPGHSNATSTNVITGATARVMLASWRDAAVSAA